MDSARITIMSRLKKFQSPNQILYFLETLWLFTLADIKTFIIPETAFGLFGMLSGSALTINPSPHLLSVLGRGGHVLLWIWLNTLIFVLANQGLPASVNEDSLNKPWRPLPAGRITVVQTRRLLLATIPTVLLITLYLGAMEETVILIGLTWMYNDLGGADESFLVRNLLNGAAFAAYGSGAIRVASGRMLPLLNAVGYQWLTVVGTIIFTTLQVQDLRDQEGDRAHQRSTIPLVLGDRAARWTVAVPVLAWSLLCPGFWALNSWGFVLPVALGCVVAGRVLFMRSVEEDASTYRVWGLWLMSLYLLPLFHNHGVLTRYLEEHSG